MPLTGIALIIIAIAVCMLVFALIPTLAAVKRTAVSLGELSDMMNSELKPALQEMTAVLSEIKAVSSTVAEHNQDVDSFLSALGETGVNVSSINRSVGAVAGILSTTSLWATGAKVAGKFVFDRYLKKRGGL